MTTKANKTQHPNALTAPQHAAMRALLSGSTVTQAAKAACVDRATCSTWLNKNGPFRDTYHAAQQELWAETHASLRAATSRAVQVVLDTLEHSGIDDRLKAALGILRMLKLSADSIKPKGKRDEELAEFFDGGWGDAARQLEEAGWPEDESE